MQIRTFEQYSGEDDLITQASEILDGFLDDFNIEKSTDGVQTNNTYTTRVVSGGHRKRLEVRINVWNDRESRLWNTDDIYIRIRESISSQILPRLEFIGMGKASVVNYEWGTIISLNDEENERRCNLSIRLYRDRPSSRSIIMA